MTVRYIPRFVPAKLGTIPHGPVQIHGTDAPRMEIGKRVRIKERPGARWISVLITRLDWAADGKLVHFFADM